MIYPPAAVTGRTVTLNAVCYVLYLAHLCCDVTCRHRK